MVVVELFPQPTDITYYFQIIKVPLCDFHFAVHSALARQMSGPFCFAQWNIHFYICICYFNYFTKQMICCHHSIHLLMASAYSYVQFARCIRPVLTKH